MREGKLEGKKTGDSSRGELLPALKGSKEEKAWVCADAKPTMLVTQCTGPLYSRPFLPAAYCICNRALTCSTGAAMKLTVHPAMVPAMAWPRAGRRLGSETSSA